MGSPWMYHGWRLHHSSCDQHFFVHEYHRSFISLLGKVVLISSLSIQIMCGVNLLASSNDTSANRDVTSNCTIWERSDTFCFLIVLLQNILLFHMSPFLYLMPLFSAVVCLHLHIVTYLSWDFHRAFLELILWDKVSCKHFLVFMILFSVMFSLLCFLMCLSHRRFPNVVKQVILHVCLLVEFINNFQNILIDSSLPHHLLDSTSW